MNAKIIYDHKELVNYLCNERMMGRKTVFTNGCFDIIHAGHVTYLEKAGSFGDLLVIALNDDASVTRLKGRRRPIFSLDERTTVIAALECVDIVTSFSDDTPLSLISMINPDILVKGGDYNQETIVGAEEVLKNGGEVKVVPYIKGQSTTELIEKIKRV